MEALERGTSLEETMRKITAGLHITLDGVVEAPEKWTSAYFTAEMIEAMSAGIAQADAVLLGRRTYEIFAGSWPGKGSNSPMAEFLNRSPKHVVSETLGELDWTNSSRITGDLRQALMKLKQRPGKNIQVPGSPTLVRWLLCNGMLDELALFVFPIVVGGGRALFDKMDLGMRLKLVESRMFSSGALCVRYQTGSV
jgi:dihydrofolate reductase